MLETDLFLSIAEIAGVFVGFGALISFSQDLRPEARTALCTVVAIGLVVLVAALIPIGLSYYGMAGRWLWGVSSAAFLAVIWTAIVSLFASPEHLAQAKADFKAYPMFTILFWVFLEVPVQTPLVLAILGVAPAFAPGFYLTALLLNLVEAALVLARMVLAPDDAPAN